ncbi:hypothetical protein [uncultured Vagococcus sp.]|uniref:hypothetical protein n=1 Tax=uncultured Vagococcus sp. TaxID=189676 RepID=UPI0028D74498|nr:hypothetical protein [uncultured Vagococcus sp.]
MITRDIRKELKLPITKDIIYFAHVVGKEYEKFEVEHIEILHTFPRGSSSLKILLVGSLLNEQKEVYILSDFLAHMQKPSFIRDMTEIDYGDYEDHF